MINTPLPLNGPKRQWQKYGLPCNVGKKNEAPVKCQYQAIKIYDQKIMMITPQELFDTKTVLDGKSKISGAQRTRRTSAPQGLRNQERNPVTRAVSEGLSEPTASNDIYF